MKRRQISISNEATQIESARMFISEGLKDMHMPAQTVWENELLLEELFLRIMEQCKDEKTVIDISLTKGISGVKILVEFPGDRFNLDFDSMEQHDLGVSVFEKYEDKVGLTYTKRRNSICIIAKRTYDKISAMCIVAMLAAVGVYGIAQAILLEDTLIALCDSFVIPLESMFANAIIMIATPVTFFSIITNVTDCFVIFDDRINLERLELNAVLTSILAEVVAVVYFFVLRNLGAGDLFVGGEIYSGSNESLSNTFVDALWSLVPQNLIEPLTSVSPFPMIFIALLISAAMCTMNKHFNMIKEMSDAVNALFSRILSIIILFMPAATFLAMLDVLIEYGFFGLLVVFAVVMFLFGAIVLMVLVAMCKVALYGVNPFVFIKQYLPAAIENFKINSSIDAIPYNIRFCNKTFGIGIDKLKTRIPILAQIDQTGNSAILMCATLFMMFFTGKDMDLVSLILLGILVIFVSLGAPGQDGTVLIGLVILFQFTGISLELIASVIYIEAIVGRLLPVLNTLFDMTTVVIESKKA